MDKEVDPRLFLVKAEEYGVPQARHRMFIVGIREDIKVRPGLLKSHKAPTVRQTIGGLPAIRSSLSQMKHTLENWHQEIARIDIPSAGSSTERPTRGPSPTASLSCRSSTSTAPRKVRPAAT